MNTRFFYRIWRLPTVLLLMLLLPLIGARFAGKDIGQYLEFPPLTRYVGHAGFSWSIFLSMAAIVLLSVAQPVLRIIGSRAVEKPIRRHPFPLWGWASAVLCLASWIMAWTRFSWFADLQIFTFSPLWLGYIGIINGLTYRRSGRCLLTHRTKYLASLFVMSTAFWWYFEYLNRYVQNWYYIGIADLSPVEYAVFASLPFSTVLPAVMSTYALLETFPRISVGLEEYKKIEIGKPATVAVAGLLIAVVGLLGIGIYPDYLFFLLWFAPLLILTASQRLAGRKTIFSPLKQGNWRRIFLLAASALLCGFFWEMWNAFSYAKWIYSIPFVQKFHIFEMPLLGYAGYLPFGLECGVIADLCEARLTQDKNQ